MHNTGSGSEPNLLHTSWHDPVWIPMLNPLNVLDYFMEKTNPFYDRMCNNEVLKMQRANPEQLGSMVGTEYCLLSFQDPVLYVIRKQHRSSPSIVTPIADYYIIAGVVYQAPDLASVLSSRLLSAVTHLQSAFEEARSYAKYHPSRGYWWDFKKTSLTSTGPTGTSVKKAKDATDQGNSSSVNGESKKKPKSNKKRKAQSSATSERMNEPSSMFQRRRVDMLLDFWARKFPPKIHTAPSGHQTSQGQPSTSQVGDKGDEIKSEKDVKSERPSSNAGFDATTGRGIKREAPSNVKQEPKKVKVS